MYGPLPKLVSRDVPIRRVLDGAAARANVDEITASELTTELGNDITCSLTGGD